MARIDDIVLIEWEMFQAVNEGGPRADCQNDRRTFEGMRRAQFLAWSDESRQAYFEDLTNAVRDGRNLVAEKYIHMMASTSPAQYAQLARNIPLPNTMQESLAREISDKLLKQTANLHKTYPHLAYSGRPLRADMDISGVISIETYQLGELFTYSENTLRLLKDHLLSLEKEGRSLAAEILENTVRFYGYTSLESAEAAVKARAVKKHIQASASFDGSDGQAVL
jgi:hypothetical protein